MTAEGFHGICKIAGCSYCIFFVRIAGVLKCLQQQAAILQRMSEAADSVYTRLRYRRGNDRVKISVPWQPCICVRRVIRSWKF